MSSKTQRFDAYKTPPFGTMLRAYRLRWTWYAKAGVFVRIAPELDKFSIEWGYQTELLDTCEVMQHLGREDYQEYLVDDEGKVVNV